MKAIQWDKQYRNGIDYAPLDTQTIARIARFGQKSGGAKRALDIGCGTGQLCRELFHYGFSVTGIDPSHEAIRIAREASIYCGTSLSFSRSSIEQFDGVANSFELITMKAVFAFIDDKPGALAIVRSLLAPGGSFVLFTPHPKFVPAHKRHITMSPETLEALLQETFSLRSTQETGKYIMYRCTQKPRARNDISATRQRPQ